MGVIKPQASESVRVCVQETFTPPEFDMQQHQSTWCLLLSFLIERYHTPKDLHRHTHMIRDRILDQMLAGFPLKS